jgi:hypothetical protein
MVDSRALRAFTPRVGRGDPDERPPLWHDEIRQIASASPGWWAVFKCPSTDGFRYHREAIAAWALVHRASGRVSIVPLVAGDGELTQPISEAGHEFRYIESDQVEDGAA